MRFDNLSAWLAWQETLHFKEIDPGLLRIRTVWKQLHGESALNFKIVTVAGTNGKGSSVALLSSICRAAGYKTASYTSPHLLSYNERIVIDGEPASDTTICHAFAAIDDARGDISLTYFEFATLAAMWIFCQQKVDVAILEVGMGGRLDAVNLFDADVALITPVALDHMHWLGDTREKIGAEKAGIMRSGRPVVCSEAHPPESVLNIAQRLQAPVTQAGLNFTYQVEGNQWHWQGDETTMRNLPLPALHGQYQLKNSAAVLAVIHLLQHHLPALNEAAIRTGLQQVSLQGRFQIIPGPVQRIFDVTHNQQGAENLCQVLRETPCAGNTFAVVAMLRDKDASSVFAALENQIDRWFVGGLIGERGQSGATLAASLLSVIPNASYDVFESVQQAYHIAMAQAEASDRVLIFGSFHTVEAVMREIPELLPVSS
ncbi:Dihydrofolate synthase / Folylpolyglutamate synthase [Methylophaga frappieri]|uniref:Dihydrofolate synthase/folylpolyglutamate synthase n=1 Tax=Methylophaga frappieri (strain ATCC BAA-2434 / DSM 25690 / JAM7) TaxID=754477 RepID=I1YL58_METFJ|nr:bifunctional tetrahydrofolate synthase/dihydrofolate synthase [Methylophaga frappieri]AFJ03651.1 Dihydrofolate synthase / Folylpolyglutamate synthase [Methylophaga frappieri]